MNDALWTLHQYFAGAGTASFACLDALAADGAMRFGLDDQPMGPVSAEHCAGTIEAMTKNACNQRSAASDA